MFMYNMLNYKQFIFLSSSKWLLKILSKRCSTVIYHYQKQNQKLIRLTEFLQDQISIKHFNEEKISITCFFYDASGNKWYISLV